MASIGAFVIGAGMTGGFAYGIHKLRKDKKTDTTKYKGFIAGLVIGIVIMMMAIFMVARGATQPTAAAGANAANQPPIALPNQLRANARATRAKIVADEGHLALVENAIKSATAAIEAQKLLEKPT
jgi:hypothetical protein